MRWTDDKREWFRAYVPGHSESEIRQAFLDEFGIELTRSQIKNAKVSLGVKSGTVNGLFEKGHVPFNKGKKWSEFGTPEGHERSRATQFKKGEIHGPKGHLKPVGYERVDKNGYVQVKVKDSLQGKANDNYRFKHRVVYEQIHGPIPDGMIIVFADKDKRNFDPDNLVAIDRSTWAVIGKNRMPYCDRESLEACMNLAKLKRASFKAKRQPRACRECGAEFIPEYPNQRRCRRCLDARAS